MSPNGNLQHKYLGVIPDEYYLMEILSVDRKSPLRSARVILRIISDHLLQ